MSGSSAPSISFDLPPKIALAAGRGRKPQVVALLPTLNVSLRMHWGKRRKLLHALQREVWVATIGNKPMRPLEKARVTVVRHSSGIPDADNLYGCVKHLLDVLQPFSKKHPFGLGFIANDSPDCLTLVVKAERSSRKDQKTSVVIEAIGPP